MKKALFLHLFDKTLSMEKEVFVLQKGLENVFNFGSKNCANPELLSTTTSMSEIICLNYVKLAEVMQEANVSKIP